MWYIDFSNTFIDPSTGDIYRKGSILKLPKLGKTLTVLADEGPDAFYNGSLTKSILEDMKRTNSSKYLEFDSFKHTIIPLTLSQTTNFRLFQIQRVCR